MYLTRHSSVDGPRWAVDGRYLPFGLRLGSLLTLPRVVMVDLLESLKGSGPEAKDNLPRAG